MKSTPHCLCCTSLCCRSGQQQQKIQRSVKIIAQMRLRKPFERHTVASHNDHPSLPVLHQQYAPSKSTATAKIQRSTKIVDQVRLRKFAKGHTTASLYEIHTLLIRCETTWEWEAGETDAIMRRWGAFCPRRRNRLLKCPENREYGRYRS